MPKMPTTKSKPKPAQPTTEPKPQPGTVKPDPPCHYLVRYNESGVGEAVEEIVLTAEQYGALKEHLAKLEHPKEAARAARFAALTEVANFLQSIRSIDFKYLEALLKIRQDDRGCITPIENFFDSLFVDYITADAEGRGLTLDSIEWRVRELRNDYNDAIEDAHFIASRYALPKEVSDAQ